MTRLFRAMKEDVDGRPEVGPSSRTLGIRPGKDVPVQRPGDVIQPHQGGMSVSPNDPINLPYFRRPPGFQGTGKDPVWSIDESDLGPDLCYRPDPVTAGHGFIEPSHPMTVAAYQLAIARTRDRWRKVNGGGSTSDDV